MLKLKNNDTRRKNTNIRVVKMRHEIKICVMVKVKTKRIKLHQRIKECRKAHISWKTGKRMKLRIAGTKYKLRGRKMSV